MIKKFIKDSVADQEITLKAAAKDKYVPEDFYSTTNHTTMIFLNKEWIKVQNQRMDAMIVVNENGVFCKKLRDIKKGDKVVCGDEGVRIVNESKKECDSFEFMNNCVSSERRNELVIKKLAYDLSAQNKKVTIVAGPVVVHTGGDVYLQELIQRGYIASFLSGNAVAVHDIEKSLFGTSLGVCAKSGRVTQNGYKNHMRAINQIMKHGSIKEAVDANELGSGIMYQCVKSGVPFVLAGSLRDDGPLPDTVADMIEAQNRYNKYLQDADIVIVLGTMLHGIASGNMLPAKTEMICVDINPAVVTKLSDRGSSQAVGIVTDVGLFLNLLVRELDSVYKVSNL
jgi:lysine-ketoglutarate reductase/saccharopine dehydrogenase-like protein (TIGR00300 family)